MGYPFPVERREPVARDPTMRQAIGKFFAEVSKLTVTSSGNGLLPGQVRSVFGLGRNIE